MAVEIASTSPLISRFLLSSAFHNVGIIEQENWCNQYKFREFPLAHCFNLCSRISMQGDTLSHDMEIVQ